jgi:hypothetical protein
MRLHSKIKSSTIIQKTPYTPSLESKSKPDSNLYELLSANEDKSVEPGEWIEVKTIKLDLKTILPEKVRILSYQLYAFMHQKTLPLPVFVGEFPQQLLFHHHKSHTKFFKKTYAIELIQPEDFDNRTLLDSFIKQELKAKVINSNTYQIYQFDTKYKTMKTIINIHLSITTTHAPKFLNDPVKLLPSFNKKGNLTHIKMIFNTIYFKNESVLKDYFKNIQPLTLFRNIPLILLSQLHFTGCSVQETSDKKIEVIVTRREHFTSDPFYILHTLKLAYEYHLLLSDQMVELTLTCAATNTYPSPSPTTWQKLLADLQFLLLNGHTFRNFMILLQYGLISILFPGATEQLQCNFSYRNLLQQQLRYLERSSITEPNINFLVTLIMVGEILAAQVDLEEINQNPQHFSKIQIEKRFESIQQGRFNYLFFRMRKTELIQMITYATTSKTLVSPSKADMKINPTRQTISPIRGVYDRATSVSFDRP